MLAIVLFCHVIVLTSVSVYSYALVSAGNRTFYLKNNLENTYMTFPSLKMISFWNFSLAIFGAEIW